MIYPGKFPPKEIKRKEQVCVFVDNTKMIKAYQWSEKGGLIEHFCLCMLSKKWERKREWVMRTHLKLGQDPPTNPIRPGGGAGWADLPPLSSFQEKNIFLKQLYSGTK